jgi:DNA-binding transcriptional ArsR family regulator
MKQPFEGLFGDTCETRLLQFLLPMYGIEFGMVDLTEEIKLTRQSISKAMKKFSDRGMVKIRKDGRTWLYSINKNSPLVKRLEDFDNSLIEAMAGPKESDKILTADRRNTPRISLSGSGHRKEKILFRHDTSGNAAPCIASRAGTSERKKGRPGIIRRTRGKGNNRFFLF